MSPNAGFTQTLTVFGDVERDLWGLAIGEAPAQWMIASFDGVPPGALESLSIQEADATSRTPEADDSLQLIRVQGALAPDPEGEDARVDLPGLKLAAVTVSKLSSMRVLGVWLPDGRQLALSARRPRGASGQDRDDVQALAAGEEFELVIDPRLSTTYDRHDAPRRVGVELWLEHEGDDTQRSRRVAGEVTGAVLSAEIGPMTLDAYALRCWSGEETGAGVYVLLRPSRS